MQNRKHSLFGFLFILPGLIGILAFYVIPFFGSLYYTFTSGVYNKVFVGLNNFLDLFGNPAFNLAVANTVVFIGIGVPLLFLLSLLVSLAMLRSGFVIERFTLLAPLIVPMAAIVAGWRLILAPEGLINQSLGSSIDFLGEEWAMPVAIALFVWKNLGYITIILTSAIVALPTEYDDVFLLESKSKARKTWMVTLPLISPMIFFSVIISVMNSFKAFREIYILFGADPPKTLYMLQHFMNNNFFKLNYQRLSTAAFMLTSILFIFIWVFLRQQNRFAKEVY